MGAKDRLKRDAAGIGPEPRRSGLFPLSELKKFRIAKGEPDIRGWEVRTLNGRNVGEVDDLLVDPESGEVVFMEVGMNNSDRHIELSLRNAQLDRDRKRVIVDSGDVDSHGPSYESRYSQRLRPEDRTGHERMVDDSEVRYADREHFVDRDPRDELDQRARDIRADADETVVERRPVVEEVVIRRRPIDADDDRTV